MPQRITPSAAARMLFPGGITRHQWPTCLLSVNAGCGADGSASRAGQSRTICQSRLAMAAKSMVDYPFSPSGKGT